MYAERELKRLNDVKVVVRRRIARRRIETIGQTDRATQPLQWVDRAYSYWTRIGPVAKFAIAPVGAWLAGSLFGKRKKVGSLMRWVPTIWSVMRGFKSASSSRRAASFRA